MKVSLSHHFLEAVEGRGEEAGLRVRKIITDGLKEYCVFIGYREMKRLRFNIVRIEKEWKISI